MVFLLIAPWYDIRTSSKNGVFADSTVIWYKDIIKKMMFLLLVPWRKAYLNKNNCKALFCFVLYVTSPSSGRNSGSPLPTNSSQLTFVPPSQVIVYRLTSSCITDMSSTVAWFCVYLYIFCIDTQRVLHNTTSISLCSNNSSHVTSEFIRIYHP